jgi:hypothetical protein
MANLMGWGGGTVGSWFIARGSWFVDRSGCS